MSVSRRGFITGMLAVAAAPAIVKAANLMPVRPRLIIPPQGLTFSAIFDGPGSRYVPAFAYADHALTAQQMSLIINGMSVRYSAILRPA